MRVRVLVVAVVALVGLWAGARITTALRTPTRTVVEPIILEPEEREADPPRPTERPTRKGRGEAGETPPANDPTGSDADVPAPAPAPPPPPARGGDDDGDDGDDRETDDGGEDGDD